MAHTLRHPELPPVVTFGQGGTSDISRELIDTFMERQLALRNNGNTAPAAGSSTELSSARVVRNAERLTDNAKTTP